MSALVPSTLQAAAAHPPSLLCWAPEFLLQALHYLVSTRAHCLYSTAGCPHLPHIESPESVPEGPAHKGVPFYPRSLSVCHVPQTRRLWCHRLMPRCSVAGGASTRVASRVLKHQVPIATATVVALLPSTSYISPSPTPPAGTPPSALGGASRVKGILISNEIQP